MVLKNIYIARHGFRANWLPEPHPPTPTGIDSDPALAPHGEEQAQELANYIFSITPQPEIILSSPFYRCVQTSLPVSKLLGIDICLENGVGEWFKKDRPTKPSPASYETLSRFFGSNLKNYWNPTLIPSLEGETDVEIFQRCVEFWEKFIPKFEAQFPEIETILFVTHAASKIALGMSLMKFSSVYETIDGEDETLRAGTCSLSKYVRLDSNDWKLTMNGNTEFLTQGEEMNWNFANGFEAGSNEDVKNRQAQNATRQSVSTKEDYTDVYVTLDIPNNAYNEIPATSRLQMSGLDDKQPLFKVGDEIYQGKWSKVMGTEVAFNENMQDGFITIKDRIHLEDVTPN
ncbi:hypothetical protein WICPIJ_003914 [Wickerhamomyces pijperi]|uniref:Transcription factor TFIIIC triple barrel domain-containing protein n=1 Tax=Wickerhamomyces pijperi TaxID=599730 RepID=A0A9P8Q708_WICPI|nr:hypothetical protein WICPIJ_003914 [Wickerhamomyces pijperi]